MRMILRVAVVTIFLFILIFVLGGCQWSRTVAPVTNDLAAREQKIQELLRFAVLELRKQNPGARANARAFLELARDINPEDPRVLDGLGCIEIQQGNLDLAERFFRRSLSVDERYDSAYAHLGFVAEKRGEFDAALELLQLSFRINPLNYRARNNYAVLLKESANEDAAKRKVAVVEFLKAYHTYSEPDIVLDYNLSKFANDEASGRNSNSKLQRRE